MLKNYLYLLLIVAFGIAGPFNNIVGAKSSDESFSNATATYATKTIQVVEVSNPVPNNTVVSVANSANVSGAVGCLAAKFTGSNSVQNQSVMNLNQPASCFRLVIGISSSPQKVSVLTASPIKTMVVVATWPVQTVISFRLNSLPTEPASSIPAQVFAFITVVMAGFGARKIIQKLNQNKSFINTVNLGSLMVMRC